MKQQIIIPFIQRVEEGSTVAGYLIKHRSWLLGKGGLNHWEYFIDMGNKDLVLTTEEYNNNDHDRRTNI